VLLPGAAACVAARPAPLSPLSPLLAPSPQERYGVDGPELGPGDLCLDCVGAQLRGLASAGSAEGLRAQAVEMIAKARGGGAAAWRGQRLWRRRALCPSW
jgi:hypothetical protein